MAGLHERVIGEYRLVSECDIVSKGPDVADAPAYDSGIRRSLSPLFFPSPHCLDI